MADHSKIEWTDATFNPWIGCTKVSPACDHCYAAVSMPARTLGITWGPGQSRVRTSLANWKLPLRWERQHQAFFAEHGRRRRVFCASLADVFDNEVDPVWRRDLFELIRATPHLDWLLLTQRIGNVRPMLEQQLRQLARYESEHRFFLDWLDGRPPANVRLGATVCNQMEADRDVPKLLEVPAAGRFLSIEPMLGAISLRWDWVSGGRPLGGGPMCNLREPWKYPEPSPAIDWVIVGGESGAGARPLHPDWARHLRDQCDAAGVSFFFKQWGEFSLDYDRDREDPDYRRCGDMARLPGRWINVAGGHGFHGERVHYAHQVGKKNSGRLLDGRQHNDYPLIEREGGAQ